MEGFGIIIIIGFVIAAIFITRLFGAWMLRIDEVIDELRAIKKILSESERNK